MGKLWRITIFFMGKSKISTAMASNTPSPENVSETRETRRNAGGASDGNPLKSALHTEIHEITMKNHYEIILNHYEITSGHH
jgi:hypothetical protein